MVNELSESINSSDVFQHLKELQARSVQSRRRAGRLAPRRLRAPSAPRRASSGSLRDRVRKARAPSSTATMPAPST
jgi:hypothetical protein